MMRTSITLLAFSASLTKANILAPRQSPSASASASAYINQQYINSVCLPNRTTGTIPPCISITTIETDCTPNGTEPIDYLASAECMCNPPSTFFADWEGCQQCLFVHGARSQNDMDAYSSIITLVSQSLCTGTPTAEFAQIFSSVAATFPYASSGATGLSDLFPSQTAVSLYYTASGSQGPGVITGSATAATKVANQTVTTLTGTKSSSGFGTTSGSGSGSTPTGSAGTSSASAASSSSEARPTNGFTFGGMVAAVGGIVMAAL